MSVDRVRLSQVDSGRLNGTLASYELFVDSRGHVRAKRINPDEDFDQAGPAITHALDGPKQIPCREVDHLAQARAESDQG